MIMCRVLFFILFRTPELFGNFEVHANGLPVDITNTYEKPEWGGDSTVKAKHVVAKPQGSHADQVTH